MAALKKLNTRSPGCKDAKKNILGLWELPWLGVPVGCGKMLRCGRIQRIRWQEANLV